MSLEATQIFIDNSAYSINGDYSPTRLESQVDAASVITHNKLQANVQNSVGLGLLGGRQVQILCTLTNDTIMLNSYLFGIKAEGQLHFIQGIQIGILALKHRMNKNQKQRLVCFIGSPIKQEESLLINLGKKLKKNNIAVDIILIGCVDQKQTSKLEKFINTVSNSDNSHLVVIKPTTNFISQHLIGTSVLGRRQNQFGQPFDSINGQVDPNIDPQLALAIKISLEEQQLKRQKQKQKQQAPQGKTLEVTQGNEEETLIQRAIEISEEGKQREEENEKKKKQKQQILEDPEFISQLLNEIEEEQSQPLIKKEEEGKQKQKQK